MRRKLAGRHPLTIGALILLGLSIYELWVRMEDFRAWFLGVKHLSEVRGTSFFEDLAIIFEVPEMRQMALKMLFLAAMVVFSCVCLLTRNRSRKMWIIFLLAILSAVAGIFLDIFALTSWVQIIKLIPLAMIAAGSVTNQVYCRKPQYEREDIPQRENRQEIPPRYNSQAIPSGYSGQAGGPQGYNGQAAPTGYTGQAVSPGFNGQPGYSRQPVQPGYNNQTIPPGYNGQAIPLGFNGQPGYNGQPIQPGYNRPPVPPEQTQQRHAQKNYSRNNHR